MGEKDVNKNNSGTHTQISVRLPNDLLGWIQKRAKAARRNRSNMIEWLLRETMRGEEKR